MHPLALAESGWVWVGAGSRPAGLRTERAKDGVMSGYGNPDLFGREDLSSIGSSWTAARQLLEPPVLFVSGAPDRMKLGTLMSLFQD